VQVEGKSHVRHGDFCSDLLKDSLGQVKPYSAIKAYHEGWLLIVEDCSVNIAGLRVCIYALNDLDHHVVQVGGRNEYIFLVAGHRNE
jgi:hypothetical protein